MRVIVSGTGRGGTNLLTELVRKITKGNVSFSQHVEDRKIFLNKIIKENYGTKLTIDHPTFTIKNAKKMLTQHKDLKILFSVRRPIDNCLSKIVRGQKYSGGGDKTTENVSADGTVETSFLSIKKLYSFINELKNSHPKQIIVVKMEDVIEKTEKVANRLFKFFNITPVPYEGFQTQNRNMYHKKRYGNELAKQVDLYLDLNKNFNGYFANKKQIVESLIDKLKNIAQDYYE